MKPNHILLCALFFSYVSKPCMKNQNFSLSIDSNRVISEYDLMLADATHDANTINFTFGCMQLQRGYVVEGRANLASVEHANPLATLHLGVSCYTQKPRDLKYAAYYLRKAAQNQQTAHLANMYQAKLKK